MPKEEDNLQAMAESEYEIHDVIVIGGGWSGILTCKAVQEDGLSVVVLEKRSSIGGVWCYNDNPETTTVMKSTKMTSSSTVTEMSDFPMPKKIGEFPQHEAVLRYIQSYCDKFDLWPLIRFSSTVIVAKKDHCGGTWLVDTENGQRFVSRYLVVCSGVHQVPNMNIMNSPVLKQFGGTIQHSGEIKCFNPQHAGKRILVIGGGETASDIVEDWYEHVKSIVWAIPRGQHFFRKYAKVLPWKCPQALDKASSRILKNIAPHCKSKPGLAWICKWTTNGSLLAYQGHGIPEWKNDAAFFHNFINKNGHVLDLVDYIKVIPKGDAIGCDGKWITFNDGMCEEIDHIILCTGYKTEFPFLPSELAEFDFRDLYKFIFNNQDPSLAFIGFVRPIVGSIPSISELQARFVSRVFSGKINLPKNGIITAEIRIDREFWEEYFKHTSQRISTLVEGYTYLDDIAKKAGVFPDFWAMFWENPRDWITALLSPYNGCTFRLNDPEYRENSLQTLKNHSKSCVSPLHLLLIFLLRLVCFDWFLHGLSYIKYKIQRSILWGRVRNNSILSKLDWVWKIPKRLLFDQMSRA